MRLDQACADGLFELEVVEIAGRAAERSRDGDRAGDRRARDRGAHDQRLHSAPDGRGTAKGAAFRSDPGGRSLSLTESFLGLKPLLIEGIPETFAALVQQAESTLQKLRLVSAGNKILVVGGMPAGEGRRANFIKIHAIR